MITDKPGSAAAGATQERDEKMLTLTAVQERGWTPAMIRQFMPVPDLIRPNPRCRSAAPMRLYSESRVQSLERTEAFAALSVQARRRSDAASAAAKRQAEELREKVKTMKVQVEAWSRRKVRRAAIEAYNEWKLVRGDFESADASASSDKAFLDRITVNFIRHNLTSYEEQVCNVAGKIGAYEARDLIAQRVYEEIGRVYPALARECRRQLDDRGLLE